MSQCADCNGKGQSWVICALRDDGNGGHVGGPAVVPCGTCNGTGIDSRDPAWIAQGRAMRNARVDAGLSLREEAKRLGVGVVELSDMERGRKQPKARAALADSAETAKR